MKNVYFNFGKNLSRRAVLRGAGDRARPALARRDDARLRRRATAAPKAKRFVGVSLALGSARPQSGPGRPAARTTSRRRYLKPLQDIRDDFTVVSGSSHPGVTGGHTAEGSIFSACPNQRGATSRNTISLDQLMAKHLGHETRFPSLVLNTGSRAAPPTPRTAR